MLGCKKLRLGAWPRAGFPEPAAAPTPRGVCAETAEPVVLEQLHPRRPWGSASVPPAPSAQPEGDPQITVGAECHPQIITREGCLPRPWGGGVLPPDHRGGGEEGGWAARELP